MRKLWSSTVPGKDRKADIIFHFYQELPKLLRGYHQCSKEEAAILGALIYRVKYAEARTDITSVIKTILPCDLVKIQSNYEWKKDIVKAYNKDSGMSPDEAKIAFLKVIYRCPTYMDQPSLKLIKSPTLVFMIRSLLLLIIKVLASSICSQM